MAQERGRPSAATRGGRETTQKAETNQEFGEDIIAFLRAAGDPAGGVS